MDWREVERELENLPEEFKDQGRFDSLPHVIEILRTLDPSQALGDLRERQERIESLVDDIVKGYHGGFNKSIHNYSEILRLFTEAQTQSKSIRTSLIALKKQLGSRTTQLRNHWQRSNVLRHTLAILDDIESIAHVPSKVDALCGIQIAGESKHRHHHHHHGASGEGKKESASTSASSVAVKQGQDQDRSVGGGGGGVGSVGDALEESEDSKLKRYEKCVKLLSFALEKLGENEDFHQVRALGEMKGSILDKTKMVKGLILRDIHHYLYPHGDDSALQVMRTRERTLSIQSPGQQQEQDELHMERLTTCMLSLDNGEDTFSMGILKEFQETLQAWIRGCWKGLEPFQAQSPKGDQKSFLCDGKLIEFVNRHFGVMCKDLEKIFGYHMDLIKSVEKNKRKKNPSQGSQEDDDHAVEETFLREIWFQIQKECIALLCSLLNVQLPVNLTKTKKLLSEGLNRRTSKAIANSDTLKFTFSIGGGRNSGKAEGRNGLKENGHLDSPSEQGRAGYDQVLNGCIEEKLQGIYLIVGANEPVHGLINYVLGQLSAISKREEPKEEKARSSILSDFLDEHILEEFVPRVKSDCTNKMKTMSTSSDQNGGAGAPTHRRTYSRDSHNVAATSSSSQNRDETKAFITVVQQIGEFSKIFPKFISHFCAIMEVMLTHFLSSVSKWDQNLEEGSNSSKKMALNLQLRDDAQDYDPKQELQKLQKLVEEFMGDVDETKYPLDGLLHLLNLLKDKC